MDKTHALVAAGGSGFGAALAAVIAAHFKIDINLATSWVVVLSGVIGAGGVWGAWLIKWKWPDAPPLPDLPLADQPPVVNPNPPPLGH